MICSVLKVYISFIIIGVSLLSSEILHAKDSPLIIIIDKDQPQYAFTVVETTRDNIFFGKAEALKKWIVLHKSELYIGKNNYLYQVKKSLIMDKVAGVVLFMIDLSDKKEMNFSLNAIKVERDIKSIIDNKKKFLSQLETLFPPLHKEENKLPLVERKEMDMLDLAIQNEKTGQVHKAIEVYEELLKVKGFSLEIASKLVSLYYKSGNYTKAIDYIQKLPRNDENTKKIVGFLIVEKNFDEALKILNSGDIKDRRYVHYLKGIIFYLMNRKNEAYTEVLELNNIDTALAESLRDLLR